MCVRGGLGWYSKWGAARVPVPSRCVCVWWGVCVCVWVCLCVCVCMHVCVFVS